eukprot:jgi/Tetstr1/456931/TSEL_043601.t1
MEPSAGEAVVKGACGWVDVDIMVVVLANGKCSCEQQRRLRDGVVFTLRDPVTSIMAAHHAPRVYENGGEAPGLLRGGPNITALGLRPDPATKICTFHVPNQPAVKVLMLNAFSGEGAGMLFNTNLGEWERPTVHMTEELFGYEPNVIHGISLPDHERLIGNAMGLHSVAWIIGQLFVEQQRLRDLEELERAARAAQAVYADGICVTSSAAEMSEAEVFQQHLQHLETVFRRLATAGIRLAPGKGHVAEWQIAFLGHRVDSEGLFPQHSKVEAVVKMPPPTDEAGLRRFLGVMGYYGKFIEQVVVSKRKPLTKLTGKVPWEWGS